MAQMAGDNAVAALKANTGLSPAELVDFLARVHIATVPPQTPTLDGWRQLLTQRGPIGVMVPSADFRTLHVIVVTGMHGDGSAQGTLVIHIDPGTGKVHEDKLDDLVKAYGLASPQPAQIWYVPR
jgi:hypothetical protein